MTRKVFLSFLGIGNYKPVEYSFNGKKMSLTKFGQVAEIEYLGKDFFDKIIIVITKGSKEKHLEKLKEELNINFSTIEISEDLTPKAQWKGFENILAEFQQNDELYLDLTHGFRAVPIMFSIAVNFLQQIKNVDLKACYYAVYDKPEKPIVDFKDFFTLNRWSDAVSRLIENADAKKLANIASQNTDFKIADLNDKEIIDSFNKLTDAIRNVDVNNISRIASNAINKILIKKETSSEMEQMLLDAVIDKFSALTTEEPLSGKYDKEYFLIQIEIIAILLEHKLYMQAFTVMREIIGSFGLIEKIDLKYETSEGRKKRVYANLFINMFQYEEKKWNFKEKDKSTVKIFENLQPYYKKLKKIGVEQELRSFVKEMTDLRNGFDHAWMSKKGVEQEIDKKGNKYFQKIKNIYQLLVKNNILN